MLLVTPEGVWPGGRHGADWLRGLRAADGGGGGLRRLTESDLIAVVIATMEGITEANGAFLRLVGYSEADLTAGRLTGRR